MEHSHLAVPDCADAVQVIKMRQNNLQVIEAVRALEEADATTAQARFRRLIAPTTDQSSSLGITRKVSAA